MSRSPSQQPKAGPRGAEGEHGRTAMGVKKTSQTQRPPRWLGPVLLLALTAGLTMFPGRGDATIAEQRARLPPPAMCKDPVSGVWQSHSFNEMYQEWGRFTLTIRRVPDSDTQLVGEIVNESWYGPATESVRGPCVGRIQYIVSMTAEGSYSDKLVEFHGIEWKMEEALCSIDAFFGYNLDRFTGVIDHDIQEFQSTNNDGGRYIDVPTVFRRVSCDDAPDVEPRVTMAPPPWYPPQEERGCGFAG